VTWFVISIIACLCSEGCIWRACPNMKSEYASLSKLVDQLQYPC
jgi:hypothetical protein